MVFHDNLHIKESYCRKDKTSMRTQSNHTSLSSSPRFSKEDLSDNIIQVAYKKVNKMLYN